MSEPLRSLSDQQILSNTDTIVAQDRKLTLRLLLHLNEIERRKLHLKRGFSSMFVYCTAHLKLSEPAAARRIRTARALAKCPELHALLESGEVNLSTVSMVAKYLKPGSDILSRIRGKSRRDVERLVAELEPRAALPPDRVRSVVVPVPAPPLAPSARGTVAGDSEKSPSPGEPDAGKSASATVAPAMEHHAVIEFTAGEDFLALVEHVRSIAAHRLPPNATFAQVFALAMKEYVKREDPIARHGRREAKSAGTRTGAASTDPRQIPAHVRDQVFARDQGRCTFTGSGGRRCNSTHMLQIDHKVPVARGGKSEMDNLRLLCAYHNRLEAGRLMGRCGPQNDASQPPGAVPN